MSARDIRRLKQEELLSLAHAHEHSAERDAAQQELLDRENGVNFVDIEGVPYCTLCQSCRCYRAKNGWIERNPGNVNYVFQYYTEQRDENET